MKPKPSPCITTRVVNTSERTWSFKNGRRNISKGTNFSKFLFIYIKESHKHFTILAIFCSVTWYSLFWKFDFLVMCSLHRDHILKAIYSSKLCETTALFLLRDCSYSKSKSINLLKRNTRNVHYFLIIPLFSPHFLPTMRARIHVVTFQGIFNSYFIERFLRIINKREGAYVYLQYLYLVLAWPGLPTPLFQSYTKFN